MIYEISSGYFKYGSHVFAVTDDITMSRTLLLERAAKEAGLERLDKYQREFDKNYEAFASGAKASCHVSFGDYYYEIRQSRIVVAIGGLATIRRSA